ncbi:uncharacterized protein LOC106094091 isoform X10 [Stomoxys calcitrans]|uniref:uncharacterized protein LOC106094091 isoform X10 n=1 Tax=Stomoxys calcitrans TaxID=35570 RepID=UPI0027E2F915|nr:uncharacterized protein LOC106094091 isoform X10 [Stomoxys calcitrans]
MFSSSIQNQHPQFHPIHANATSVKPKKRRKRRRKPLQTSVLTIASAPCTTISPSDNKRNISTTNSAINKSQKLMQKEQNTTTTSTSLAKSFKQYFQHDNRLVNTQQTIQHQQQHHHHHSLTSTIFTKYTSESEMLYAEVAKKFKPLKPKRSTKQVVSKQKSKALLKQQYSLRKHKLSALGVQRGLTLAEHNKSRNHHPKENKQKPAALGMQSQHCLCSCPNHNIGHNVTETAGLVAHINTTSLCSNKISNPTQYIAATTTPINAASSRTTTSNNNYLSCFNFNDTAATLPKLLGILQSSAPTLLLETLLNNAQILEGKHLDQSVRDTHQIAEAQQEKNAKLREAFNISEYFVEGSSFDSDRKAKEDLAKSLALQKELDAQREQAAAAASAAAAKEKESSKRYALVRTPSRERDVSASGGGGGGVVGGNGDNDEHSIKKKKKKRTRESSASPERKKDKKKKSKKHKKESKSKKKKSRKRKSSESDSADADNAKDTADENDSSDSEGEVKKSRKKSKKDKDSFRKAV